MVPSSNGNRFFRKYIMLLAHSKIYKRILLSKYFQPNKNIKINSVNRYCYTESYPAIPIQQINNGTTYAKYNNKAYKYPKKYIPIMLIHYTYTSLLKAVKHVINRHDTKYKQNLLKVLLTLKTSHDKITQISNYEKFFQKLWIIYQKP